MEKELQLANDLIDFIYKSPTAFHATKSVKERFEENGFKEIKVADKWDLEKEGKYFVIFNDSAIIAFTIGKGEIESNGFKLIGAHTDSPSFRIKPNPEMVSENSYLKLNTEVYGGPIINTWLDRPLSLAGRVTLKGENIFSPRIELVNIKRPILIIPNVAIHMNHGVNKGIELNKQKDTLPLLALVEEKFEKDNFLVKLLAKELNVKEDEIIDFDLFLYEFEKGTVLGLNNELISSPRLDDLAMVFSGVEALINSNVSNSTNVMICFDNEEVGSSTKQGADSPMLISTLERICLALNKNREEFLRAISKSYIISADLAHAVHPNSGEKHDPVNRPMVNKGPAIKINANQSYTTDSYSDSIYELICKKAGVPVQKFVNRSDERGGSTIGPISSTHLNIASVDMGTPILAMHSIRELGGVKDNYYVLKSFTEFYNL